MTNDEVLLAADRMTAMIRRIFCAAGANNQEAQAIAAACLEMSTGDEVRHHLESAIGEYLPFWHQGHH